MRSAIVPKDLKIPLGAKGAMTIGDAYDAVQLFIASAISWYLMKKASKRKQARAVRFMTILTAIAGGLVPVGASLWPSVPPAAGYVLLGVAGGLQLLDRTFGLSTGWSGHLLTALKLQEISLELSLAYSHLENGAGKDDGPRWELLTEASQKTWQVIGAETDAWANNLITAGKEISAQTELGATPMSTAEKST